MMAETLKLDPKNASSHMLSGEVLMARSDTPAAIRALETAREQAPDPVRIRMDLLRAYLQAGRKEDANREKAEIQRLSQSHTRP